MEEQVFWKKKLMAFLHDPPCKAMDIPGHEERAKSFRAAAGITDDDYKEFRKICDHWASTADRFPFPNQVDCRAAFNDKNPFKHPISGESIKYLDMATADLAEGKLQGAINVVDTDSWKSRFLVYWRRWADEAAKVDPRFAFFPADTRLPDHTIWNHMSLTSAFSSCTDDNGQMTPAFLLMQIAPVQEFIAQARSTADLWSGSYLLSYLTWQGLWRVAENIGPDNIIFPALYNQPLVDIELKEHYSQNKLQDGSTLADYINVDKEKLKIASIPNRFLALIPADKAEMLASAAENAIRQTWQEIAEKVFDSLSKIMPDAANYRERFFKQTEKFLQISYQILPWQDDLPLDENLTALKAFTETQIPEADRDKRFYNADKGVLTNPAFTWPAQYTLCNKLLAARRCTRNFTQFNTDDAQAGTVKDWLSGKEEVIGSEADWKKLLSAPAGVFKDTDHPMGAINLIKRLWYCKDGADYFAIKHQQEIKSDFDSVVKVAGGSKYFAVIALDGDEMGKMLSGEKLPLLKNQMAANPAGYFAKLSSTQFEKLKRPLSPSFHMQFSEALGNFSIFVVPEIVKNHQGQLIYAGGDDVLCMVPAQNALSCANELQQSFRKIQHEITIESGGKPETKSIIMPGCNASCGIAVAHVKHPLQCVINEARKAEHKAKNAYSRNAFAMTLLKRSGEILEWGANWNSGAVELFNKYNENVEQISNRFPYALAERLQLYDLADGKTTNPAALKEVIARELAEVVDRQNGTVFIAEAQAFLDHLAANGKGFKDFEQLFLAAAFINRNNSEEE